MSKKKTKTLQLPNTQEVEADLHIGNVVISADDFSEVLWEVRTIYMGREHERKGYGWDYAEVLAAVATAAASEPLTQEVMENVLFGFSDQIDAMPENTEEQKQEKIKHLSNVYVHKNRNY